MRLIDADELINLIVNESRTWEDEYGISDVLKNIADFPTVGPIKHGHWVYAGQGWAGEGIYKCSICGHHTPDNANYCPCCGAKMDEVEDG